MRFGLKLRMPITMKTFLEMDDNGSITVLTYFASMGCTLKNGHFKLCIFDQKRLKEQVFTEQ